MIEVTGNLWDYPAIVRVITTNGAVKNNGECVMGRGCALEAKRKYPGIATRLGSAIIRDGNVPNYLGMYGGAEIYSFPVKHHWRERADLNLIQQSAIRLVDILDELFPNDEGHVFVLPRPGCGNGNLLWENVKPVLEPILDDRFHVITFR